MFSSLPSNLGRARWVPLCLSVIMAGCDPLSLLSLFGAPETGASVLTLLDTQGREVRVGEQVEGALSAADYIGVNESYLEAWALEADAGQTVSIDLISSAFDSYLYVVGPGLGETLRDDDSGGACHARLDFTVLEAGTFRVVASSSSSRQAGTYQLRVSEEASPAAVMSCGGIDGSQLSALSTAGRVLTRGERAFGHLSGAEASIENDRPVQAWAFAGEAGETATIRLESDDFDAYLYFFGPGLVETMTNDDGGDGLNSELTVTFAETGVYTVGAGALSSGATGSYSIVVTDPVDLSMLSSEDRLLRVGSNEVGTLTDADLLFEGQRVQAWALRVRAGDAVTIDMSSEAFDSYLRVSGPGLPDHLSDDDSGEDLDSRLSVSFPQDGVYSVIASSLGGDTGAFTLRVR